jgi:glucose/arabinose dehydrogenase
MRFALAAGVAAIVAVLSGGSPTTAFALPSSFSDSLVASVPNPTGLAFTPDGRLLVTAQFGQLRVVQNGTLLAQPALDISPVICTAEEEGVLGLAVDPAFATNGFIYIYYTRSEGGGVCTNRVSRFTMSGNTAALSSELVLIDEIPAPGGYHNAGDLQFGKDGYLYVSVGDGGCDYANDSGCAGANDASRDQNVLVGKILRVTSTGGIPPSNPFQGAGTARCNVTGQTAVGTKCQETFAWGLRNPFRFAFDPNAAGTRFYINDVGDANWEEIDDGTSGADYGWNVREGPCVNGSTTNCGAPPSGMTNPVYSYSHAESTCHAITGGAFVPNGAWPASYNGTYLYGDYTCDTIFLLTPDGAGGFTRTAFAAGVGAIVNLKFGPSTQGQSLYYTNYTNGGEIHRVDFTGTANRAPTAKVTASPTSGPVPLTVNFDGGGSTDPDTGDTLTYTWNFGDGTAAVTTASPTISHNYSTAGTRTASLVVTDNHGAPSTAATVRIDPGNTPPQVTINTPSTTTRFAVGQAITLHATATDAQDGTLPASSLSWTIIRHHDTHTHPFLAPTTGNDIPITGPAPEDLAAASNSYLEIQLTATDSSGLSTTVTQNLLPKKVDLTFATSPTGLRVELNTFPYTAPSTVTSWEGYVLGVNAPAQVDGTGKSWSFKSWSDGGSASHSVTTPAVAATYTATFSQSTAPPGLVAAYSFDAGTGTTAADSSGSGNVGTISGATWTAAGKYGSALSFDGTSNWVTVNDSNSLDLTSSLTLEAWVKPTALGASWRTVLFKEKPGGMVYSLYANQDTTRPIGQVFVGSERNATGTAALGLNTWTHLASTYDGANLRLYVNGTLATTTAVTGAMTPSTGALRIGGNSIWSEWFSGAIDDVRVYNRALAQSEIQTDMQTPIGGGPPPPPPDTTPPSAPSGLAASTAIGRANLTWAASSDNIGVVRYNVHRSPTANFTPSAANRIAQPTTTSYSDSGLAGGTYYYRVTAEDAAGNVSASSSEVTAVVPADQPPAVALTAPAAGSTVTGSVAVSANASDDVGVAGVQFKLDGANLGVEDTSSPYSVSWDTKTATNGSHVLSAVARDSAAHSTTSATVSVTVNNTAPPTGLVAAYSFNAGSGTTAADGSGTGNPGTISGAAWTASGKYGAALSFNGANSWVTVGDSNSLDLTNGLTLEAWVQPAALGTTWRTVIFKERPGGMVYSLYANQDTSRPVGQVFTGAERNVTGTAALGLNVWTHLGSTYDGANLRLYVNGVLVATTAVTGAMSASTGVLRIGGNSIWNEWFSGAIDEVRVYNRALSQSQIQSDMTTPLG